MISSGNHPLVKYRDCIHVNPNSRSALFGSLKVMKEKSFKKFIVGHLNINSVSKNLEILENVISDSLNITLFSKLVIHFLQHNKRYCVR